MDVARCTLDDVSYTAVNFSKLTAAEQSKKRKHLICPECEGKAYYRKASTGGQAACFGAIPHKDHCHFATTEHKLSDSETNRDRNAIVNPGQRIVLDLNFGTQILKSQNVQEKSSSGARTGNRFTGNGVPTEAVMSRTLGSILKTLCMSEQLQTSSQVIEIPDKGEFIAANLFVKFSALTSSHDNQYGGYWGEISDVGTSKGPTLWLNAVGPEPYYMGIIVPADLIDAFSKRFPKKAGKDWVSTALVFGTMQVGSGGKRYIRVDDLAFITVQ